MRWIRSGISGVVLLTLAAAAGQAQEERVIDFGLMGGGTFSKFGGKDMGDFNKTNVGFAAGGFVTLGLGPYFAIEPEVLWVQKGAKNEVDDTKFAISYVQIPFLAKFRIPAKGDGMQVSPHLYAGAALAFKVACTVSSGTNSDSCEDVGADVKRNDLSFVFGAGVDIGRAMIGGRYDLGLMKIDRSANPEDVKNRTFSLLVGWTFRSPR